MHKTETNDHKNNITYTLQTDFPTHVIYLTFEGD